MDARRDEDEFGVFWQCDACLTCHDDAKDAASCCRQRYEEHSVDMSKMIFEKPLTERQIKALSLPEFVPHNGREHFKGRRSI